MNNNSDKAERIKRLMYLMEYDNRKTDKKILKENVTAIFESKQTEQQALAILRKSNSKDDSANQQIINRLRASDTSKNQVLIPIMAKMYTESGVGEAGLRELQQLFVSVSEMVNSNKIGVPVISDAGYVVNNKTFTNYLKFAEFIHGLEGMSKGHAQWKGKINMETDEPPIWEGKGIKIYDGNDVGKCIKYTTGGLTGKHYGFCIGQPANTMWQSYRDNKTSTFHYVIDSNRDLSDPLHIVVVDATQHRIELTDASNHTGHIAEYGNDAEKYLEYLKSKGAPVDKLFINKPKTPEENAEQAKLGHKNEDLQWFKDLTFEEKSKYIGRGHLLSDNQFKYLWNFKNDKGGFHLLHQYVDTGQAIPEKQFNILVGEE
jgi:hypothetical protein